MSCLLSISSQRAQVGLFTVKMMRAHPNSTADIIHLQAVELGGSLLEDYQSALEEPEGTNRDKSNTQYRTVSHTWLKLHNRNSLPHYQLYI